MAKKKNLVRIGIAGAGGRMGRNLLEITKRMECLEKHVVLAAALEHAKHKSLGKNTAELCETDTKKNNQVFLADSFNPSEVNVFIDFSMPEAAVKLAQKCRKHKIAMVIGVTGFSDAQKKELAAAAKSIPLLAAPNMSRGVLSMFDLAREAAKLFNKDYDIEVCETHHRHKKDFPSGTALRLGEIVADELGKPLGKVARYGLPRKNNPKRKENEIGFSALRAGDIIGEHRVIFAGDGEQVEIIHRSTNRMGYAAGAVQAAMGIVGKKPGLYSMEDAKKWKV